MSTSKKTYSNKGKTQINELKQGVKTLVFNTLQTVALLISSVKLLKSLAFNPTYSYICTNCTRSTSLRNSKRVLFSESYITKDNTPSRLTKVAHLGGLFFYKSLVG
ncbi:hypothetical protein [Aquimarina agarivorans]|uniref:hypothetical protein n=1 Tax=Aquimarina agarivorans TaxID=980584 RepID=UPI000248FC3F|nr:hypothetical protein [Aquimarina agarivorans]